MSFPYPGTPPQQGGWGPAPQSYQQPQQGGWGPPAPGGWQQPPQQPQQGGWGQPPAQQGWGPPAPQDQQWAQQQDQTPAPAQGTLADFYQQKSVGGGAALKFRNVGDWHIGIINRAIVDSDTEQQVGMKGTPNAGKPLVNSDNSPKWVLKVPLNVPPSEDHTDGLARWYCQGVARDLFNAAIARSGTPITTVETDRGPVQFYSPEPGAAVMVKLAGKRKIPGLNDANIPEVQYWRPGPEARQIAQHYGIEYPVIADAGQPATPSSLPASAQPQATGQFPQQPSAPAPQQFPAQPAAQAGPPPSVADFAPPMPGQLGNPAQWGQQSAQQQFPAWGAVDNQPAQAANNGPQGVPGAPPPVAWGQGQQPNGQNSSQGHIPQATPPAGPPPGMSPETAALAAQLTGRQ